MLLHITQTHTAELCPKGEGGSKTLYDPKAEGVKFLAMYGAFSEHTIYYIVEAETLEAAFEGGGEMFGAGVVSPLRGAGTLPSAFGCDDESRGIGIESFCDQFFRGAGAVGVGGVDKIDAELAVAAEGA